jgi:hypothetical protein
VLISGPEEATALTISGAVAFVVRSRWLTSDGPDAYAREGAALAHV